MNHTQERGELSAIQLLESFMFTEMGRFEPQQQNTFIQAVNQIIRYRQFLDLILARYHHLCGEHQRVTDVIVNGQPDQASDLIGKSGLLSAHLHLDIESFYLFAKILLDKIARFIEYYFGPVRKLALDSHDDVDRRLENYIECKQLQPIPEMTTAVTDCRRRISDFRDYQIAHAKSPQTVYATTWGPDGLHKIMQSRFDRGEHRETEALPGLLSTIDDYLGLVLMFILANRDQTNLKLVQAVQ